MTYCKLVFQSIPRVIFAHGYTTSRYHLHFPPAPGMLEISCIEQGDIRRIYADGRTFEAAAPCFLFSRYEEPFDMHSDAPMHRHVTVGFRADYEAHDISREEVALFARQAFEPDAQTPLTAILPDCMRMDEQGGELERQMGEILRAFATPSGTRELACGGMLLLLLSSLTEACLREILQEDSRFSLANVVYARRAMQIVADNLHRQIRVEEVAAKLGISAGHLSRLFRQVTGQTLTAYVNRAKCERIKALLTNNHATLREAGESVGFDDVNYVSRLFHKVTGLTAQEYRMLQKDQQEE